MIVTMDCSADSSWYDDDILLKENQTISKITGQTMYRKWYACTVHPTTETLTHCNRTTGQSQSCMKQSCMIAADLQSSQN